MQCTIWLEASQSTNQANKRSFHNDACFFLVFVISYCPYGNECWLVNRLEYVHIMQTCSVHPTNIRKMPFWYCWNTRLNAYTFLFFEHITCIYVIVNYNCTYIQWRIVRTGHEYVISGIYIRMFSKIITHVYWAHKMEFVACILFDREKINTLKNRSTKS